MIPEDQKNITTQLDFFLQHLHCHIDTLQLLALTIFAKFCDYNLKLCMFATVPGVLH